MMYRFFVACSLLVSCSMVSCNQGADDGKIPTSVVQNPLSASGEHSVDNLPLCTVEKDTYDFGKVIQGEKVKYDFKITNTGKSDLLISNVTTSCGCTATEFPRKPIKPGDEGFVTVTFDSEGRNGFQNKRISVVANTQPNTTVLYIKAQVVVM